jgi:hypothetical protein
MRENNEGETNKIKDCQMVYFLPTKLMKQQMIVFTNDGQLNEIIHKRKNNN